MLAWRRGTKGLMAWANAGGALVKWARRVQEHAQEDRRAKTKKKCYSSYRYNLREDAVSIEDD